jgi:hypothetical protein
MIRRRYRGHWPESIDLIPKMPCLRWSRAAQRVSRTPHKLYLLIDEYDNFANEVLMADRSGSQDRYQTLLQGEGLLKTVFKAVKAAAGGLGAGPRLHHRRLARGAERHDQRLQRRRRHLLEGGIQRPVRFQRDGDRNRTGSTGTRRRRLVP